MLLLIREAVLFCKQPFAVAVVFLAMGKVHSLYSRQRLPVPLEKVWAFFSDASVFFLAVGQQVLKALAAGNEKPHRQQKRATPLPGCRKCASSPVISVLGGDFFSFHTSPWKLFLLGIKINTRPTTKSQKR